MTNQKVNPKLLKAAKAFEPASTPRSAYLLEPDVQAGIDELHRAGGGQKAKTKIVNDLLRAALFSDAIADALVKEA
jgi:hypothetical protein